ncbi:MAG: stage V sporulation protein AC [Sporomusaceae bacterium]|nr:stage V sporulation protein AC [Sporomusaceae bacterium]
MGEVSVSDGRQGQQEFQKWYQARYNQVKPKPPILKNAFWAFIVGGLICTLGQVIQTYFVGFGLSQKEAAGPTSAVLIFLSALFTGLGIYDELGRRAGAGSIVPITGFANSIVAPAMEYKREGYVFGVGAKMFLIAGPVIVYGLITAVGVGLIYWAFS